MSQRRLKHTFTSGELSPLMYGRTDFTGFKNGCKLLLNAMVSVQGPAFRRPGLKFIYDLSALDIDVDYPYIRLIPFERSQETYYCLVFFKTNTGSIRVCFFNKDQIIDVTGSGGYYITLDSTWDIKNFDWAQTLDEIYITQRGLPVKKLVYYGPGHATEGIWELEDVVFDSEPEVDGSPSWSSDNGYPERVTFHQQRLVLAANILYRDKLWLSEAGAYLTFDPPATPVESSALSFTLASGTYNRIQWLSSSKSLHVGTVGDEWTVTGSDQIAITGTSKLALRQTKVGSMAIKPVVIGQTTLFLSYFGRTVNEFVYDYSLESYKTSDLSILSPHVTESYSLKDWTYQQTPDSIIWTIREDGAMYGITYQRDHKVVAWHGHNTQGKFRACTATPGDTREDDLWVAVERERGSTPGADKTVLIEKMADKFVSWDAKYGKFSDSFVDYHISVPNPSTKASIVPIYCLIMCDDDDIVIPPPPNTSLPDGYPQPTELVSNDDGDVTFTGLDHLEDMLVDILISGAVYPSQIVENGEVTVLRAIAKDADGDLIEDAQLGFHIAVIGLSYQTYIRPLLGELPQPDGTMQGKMQRISKLDIHFYNSLGLYIGRINPDTLVGREEEIAFRNPGDATGQGVPLFSGIYEWDYQEGYDRESDYTIRQRQPLPLTIRSIVDTIEVED